jgi:hydroxymethylbilane synthase
MNLKPALTIGTRASKLALAQAALTRAALMNAHGFHESHVTIQPMTTTGDQLKDHSLADAGGKGLFTKEIEEALLAGKIDIAVHSAKDMPAEIPRGLMLAACLPREDARDCLVGKKLAMLPQGATLGTSSPRRVAMMKRLRPDLKIIDFRGNVDTRLAKIARGEADATLLALAGLKRIGMASKAAEILDLETFPPAAGQGAIVIEVRENDERTRNLLEAINDVPTFTALLTERAFLNVLDGSCRTPIAGHAVVTDKIAFHGMILKPDGTQVFEARMQGALHEAEKLGRTAGLELKARAPAGFFEEK